jgi:predicted P-loop ATPase
MSAPFSQHARPIKEITYDAFECALHNKGCNPRNGVALCPVHETDGAGHKPSLTYAPGSTHDVVFKCHAGCSHDAILAALNLPTATASASRRIVATYAYRDAAGSLVFEKIRYEPKDFRIRHRDASGLEVWKIPRGTEPPLYRLPEVVAAIAAGETVYLVEGEKDADRLAAAGLCATTNFDGAAAGTKPKWKSSYTATLAGADVVLIPDNDEPGMAHMRHAAAALAGTARVRLLELPGLHAKGDVSDWLNSGRTVAEFKALADAAKVWDAGNNDNTEPADGNPKLELKTKHGEPVPSFGNAFRILESSVFKYSIAFNEFAGIIQKIGDLPWATESQEWNDTDTNELMLWCGIHHKIDLSADVSERAISLIAHRNKFNPAQNRLKSLSEQWDGVNRINSWLLNYMNAATDESSERYLSEIGSNWLKGLCARVLYPGCKRDDVLVFVGLQGYLKSTAAMAISDCIYPNAFNDSLGNLGSDEAANGIRGIIIAEFSELSCVARSELELVKAFVTRTNDRFREKYARHPSDHLRTCSFIATTNEDCGFLRDASGNRRWWPITIRRRIDIDALKSALPQLLGEASHRVLNGESWHVTDAEALLQADEIRMDHSESDIWDSAIMDAVSAIDFRALTLSKILDYMGIKVERQDRVSQNRVSNVLRSNGFKRVRGRVNGVRSYVWHPKDCPPSPPMGDKWGTAV